MNDNRFPDHQHLRSTDAIGERRDAALAEARSLADTGDLTGDDAARFDELTDEVEVLNEKHERFARIQAAAQNPANLERGAGDGPQVLKRTDPWGGDMTRLAHDPDVKQRAHTAIERMEGTDELRQAADDVVRKNRGDIAESFVVRSNPDYLTAWQKLVTDPTTAHLKFSDAEADAVRSVLALEQRAMSVGTTSAGGAMTPTFLDPAIIQAGTGSSNPFRQVARVVQTTQAQWDGVTGNEVTASWDAEAAEVSDDTMVLTQPSIEVHKGAAFIPASFEIIEDVEGLATELAVMFADAKDRLEADAFHDGSGSGEPEGIITGLSGGPNYTAMSTNSVFAVGDIMTTAEALPPRYRDRGAWMMDQVLLHDVLEMGGTNYYSRSGDLASGPAGTILGKPVYECSQFSSTLDGDTNENIVYGDWSGYVIADRIASNLSYIPHLFSSSNGRPTGSAGWYLHWRTGAEAVNSTSFVLTYNPST